MTEFASTAEACIRHITIILNPTAGHGHAAQRRPELERLLATAVQSLRESQSAYTVEWRIVETRAAGEAKALATTAAEQGADLIVAAGGDGTCGEVADGILGTATRLGVLPLGTGNDFARSIGVGTELDKAVHTLFHGKPHAIDVGRVQTAGVDRRFLSVAGCGFDSVVTERVNRGVGPFQGAAAYLMGVVECLATFKPVQMRLTIDGAPRELRAMLCSVCNAQSYGGGMRIAPDAKLDDGFFDVCLLAKASPVEFLRAFPRVYKGTHITHPKVTMLRARHVTVECDPPMPILIDGDVVGRTPVEFSLIPRAVEIIAPTTLSPALTPTNTN